MWVSLKWKEEERYLSSETLQRCVAVTIFVLSSFSHLHGDKRDEGWIAAKRGSPAVQLKVLQGKQEETWAAAGEEKEEKKKVRQMSELFSLPLPVCPLCACLSHFFFFISC